MVKRENKYFGTDGIRGVVGDDVMNQDTAYRLGQAMVAFASKNNLENKFIIGHDTRWSAQELESAVVAGIRKVGGEVLLAGLIPTPGLVLLSRIEDVGMGLMITASHNDYTFNGFKLVDNQGKKLSLEQETEFEILIDKVESFPKDLELISEEGDTKYRDKYSDFLLNIFREDDFSDLNVVLDCANGATVEVSPKVFTEKVKNCNSLFVFPDGKNINDNCGSQYPTVLAEEVRKKGADIGLAFDGDGDRIIVVDEQGEVLTGDHILYILVMMFKAQGELKNDIVVSTVMSNIGFVKRLNEEGIEHKQTDVGDSVVCRGMEEVGAVLGGEEAGHIILSSYHTSGDGVLSALMMLRALKHFGKPLSELAKGFKSYPKVLKNIVVKTKPEISSLPELVELIKIIEEELGEDGRVLVRYSGTEPKCRVMVEGLDEVQVEKYVDRIIKKIDDLLN